ncbi:ribose 5-phosphate isomerase B [Brevibacillus massiliensis]|uniref:ribose 5-phosphate isomerase B n=1 Tax=Brevibacillus massiliensis TaxID=1118054 RepID=UPI0002F68A02|nr:ribose 5-phosphate isomerase B [Brevibacillus massiliensis]
MKIAVGSDHHGFAYKEVIKQYLQDNHHEVIDYGCYSCDEVDYPGVAFEVGKDIVNGKAERGILICGTGIGVAIAAGKVPGIRAALCHDTYSAERSQKSNNAQILTLGAKVIGIEAALKVVETWVNSKYEGGNSGRKIQQIMDQEQEFLKAGLADETTNPTKC